MQTHDADLPCLLHHENDCYRLFSVALKDDLEDELQAENEDNGEEAGKTWAHLIPLNSQLKKMGESLSSTVSNKSCP